MILMHSMLFDNPAYEMIVGDGVGEQLDDSTFCMINDESYH